MKPIFPTIIFSVFLSFVLFVPMSCSQAIESQKNKIQAVAGTRVSLEPPEGFSPATQFPGFQLESLGSSIMVNEIPGPFAITSSGFSNPSKLAEKGMSLLERQEIESNGRDSLLVKTQQSAYGVDFLKWHLIIGDEKQTVIITATFPKQFEAKISEKIKASLLSTVWDRNKEVSPTEGVNYRVDELGDMKLANRMSNLLSYTKNGKFPNRDLTEPLFIVGQAISKTAIPDNEQYAKARVHQISQLTDIEVEQTTKITIDNLDGYEIFAKGKDNKTQQLIAVYQVMLFEEHNYYLMQGYIGDKNRQPGFEVFKQMAKTFRRIK